MNKMITKNLHLINRKLSSEIMTQIIASQQDLVLISDGIYLLRTLDQQNIYVIANDLQARLPNYPSAALKIINYSEFISMSLDYNVISW